MRDLCTVIRGSHDKVTDVSMTLMETVLIRLNNKAYGEDVVIINKEPMPRGLGTDLGIISIGKEYKNWVFFAGTALNLEHETYWSVR